MKIDKIQEAYNKMLSEKVKFKYMGKANDIMADFLEELEDSLPSPRDPSAKFSGVNKGKKLHDDFLDIERDWENLWDNIVDLSKKI